MTATSSGRIPTTAESSVRGSHARSIQEVTAVWGFPATASEFMIALPALRSILVACWGVR